MPPQLPRMPKRPGRGLQARIKRFLGDGKRLRAVKVGAMRDWRRPTVIATQWCSAHKIGFPDPRALGRLLEGPAGAHVKAGLVELVAAMEHHQTALEGMGRLRDRSTFEMAKTAQPTLTPEAYLAAAREVRELLKADLLTAMKSARAAARQIEETAARQGP